MTSDKKGSKQQHVKLIAVVPVGPDDNGEDTIESLLTYCTGSIAILAIDDSRQPETRRFLETVSPKVTCLPSFAGQPHPHAAPLPDRWLRRFLDRRHGAGIHLRGALFYNLAQTYQYALEHFTFDVLLRIDTDALIIGRKPEDEALQFFAQHPKTGMLGVYKVASNGQPRNFDIVAEAINREAGVLGLVNHRRRAVLRDWRLQAQYHGYRTGEHCLGAVVYIRPETLAAMDHRGYLDQASAFHISINSEDHLFSMLTIACGYQLADFGTGNLPMDISWRGMPRAPQDIDTTVKKIVHSTKYWQNMSWEEIGGYFRRQREAERGLVM